MLLGAAAQAGRGPQRRLGVLCDAAQHEVEVGGGGHGVEDVGFVRDEELWAEETQRTVRRLLGKESLGNEDVFSHANTLRF